jgi:hypothetical protein
MLPRDVERDGKTFTQLYRARARAGRAVYLENSKAGEATGHSSHVFEIIINNGREEIGQEISKNFSLGVAMDVANKE